MHTVTDHNNFYKVVMVRHNTTKGSQMYIVYVMPPTPGEATGA